MGKVILEFDFDDCLTDGERLGKQEAMLQNSVEIFLRKNPAYTRNEVKITRKTPFTRKGVNLFWIEYSPSEENED